MKLRRCIKWRNGCLAFTVFLCLQVTAQDSQKSSSSTAQSPQSIVPLLNPPTSSVLDGIPLKRPAPTPAPSLSIPGTYVSPWLVEIVKLVQAQIDDTVVVTFIDSAGTFNLDAEQIIYLRKLGLSGEMISIMLAHDGEIVAGLRPIPPAPAASPATVRLGSSAGPLKASQPVPSVTITNSAVQQLASAQNILPKNSENYGQSIAIPATTTEPDEEEFDFAVVHTKSTPPSTFSPVRQPYAVQLVDPIVVFRSPGRTPNLMRLEVLP